MLWCYWFTIRKHTVLSTYKCPSTVSTKNFLVRHWRLGLSNVRHGEVGCLKRAEWDGMICCMWWQKWDVTMFTGWVNKTRETCGCSIIDLWEQVLTHIKGMLNRILFDIYSNVDELWNYQLYIIKYHVYRIIHISYNSYIMLSSECSSVCSGQIYCIWEIISTRWWQLLFWRSSA